MATAKRIFFGLFLFISITSAVYGQQVNIKIIQTTDEHGKIFPFDFTEGVPSNGSLAQVYSYVQSEREKQNQDVILLSNGDILQGTPAVYYYNYEAPNESHVYSDVMNYMKYDAGTVGNHDIETGHPVYDKFNKSINFPWLAANAVHVESKEPYFQPYTVIEKRGLKIAVLGLITPAIPKWLPQNIWSGILFEDMIETAELWARIIQANENPDLLVGLFHAGVDYTYAEQADTTYKNENASELVAKRVPGFDMVYVGHDHHGWNKYVENNFGDKVLILGGTSSARNVAVADVTFNFDSTNNVWNKDISGSIIEMKDYQPDPIFLSKFNYAFDETQKYVNRTIGEFTSSISARESIFGNSSFTDLIHTIQMDLTGADISLTAPLSMDSIIDSGIVTVGDMFNLYRYENLLYTMELSGQEIKDYLEYSYASWFNTMDSPEDNLLQFRRNENGDLILSNRSGRAELNYRFYNFDSAFGIDYTVDVTKPIGKKIRIEQFTDGSEFNLDKKFKVAVNSYRGNGGGGHLVEGARIPADKLSERVITSTDKDLRYYLMKWIENKGKVTPKAYGNWKVIPENFWNAAKVKDYNLLYN
ncbi:MAG: bifunctional metallophosphatase/5'-nucleotidase [Bacteroidetes bacterium]|nr:bifunctional metallophosphatase/5'-nucleotidase [Bacteroidota bacterium]MBU2507362.1 bifunctional metallophosphatase/5'-nucleotidase [Bacteroidota bacterium]